MLIYAQMDQRDGEKMKLDITKLTAGSIIANASMTLQGCAIRVRTWGWKAILDMSKTNHIIIACKAPEGILYGMEMIPPKIHRIDLNEIQNICWQYTDSRIASDTNFQLAANDFLWKAYAAGIRYDWLGILEFLGWPHDNAKKYYCSEMYQAMLLKIGVPHPVEWDKKCSPADLQKYYKGV